MDDDEYKLVDSPLCRKIRRNRTFVLVHIYRGEADSDWTLEVEDEKGGSTVWTETFISDKAALTEVMSVIEEEGIETFMVEEKRTLH